MLRLFLMSCLCLWWSFPALATPVAGQTDSAFEAAVQAWLADDEEAALTRLATLAGAGLSAAQVLLAIIDKTPELQGPWLSMLPAAQRNALMRAPGGTSGQSWMRAAAPQEPLARLWVTLWDVNAPLDLGLEFARHGEDRAAREAVLTLYARQHRGFAGLADDPHFPDAMRFIAALEDPAIAHDAPVDITDMQIPLAADAAPWLRDATEAAPLRALCDTVCPQSAGSCTLAAYKALGSHQRALSLGSPVEGLIPTADFVTSPRGRATVLRKIMLSTDARGRIGLLTRTKATDMCLADVLNAEFARYRIHLPVITPEAVAPEGR